MRRGVFAEWAVLLSLLAAQAGCNWVGLRRWSDRPTPTPEEAAQAQQVIEHAQAAIDHGDIAAAEAALEQQVARTPASAVAQQRLGAVYLLDGRLTEAKECFSRALKIDPDYVDAVIGLGQVESLEGDAESARKRFETAIEIDPHRTQAHFSLGSVLQIMGQIDPALAEYFRAIECEPNHAQASRCIAAIQLSRNQPEQAISRLDRVLEMAADDGEARFLRGRATGARAHRGGGHRSSARDSRAARPRGYLLPPGARIRGPPQNRRCTHRGQGGHATRARLRTGPATLEPPQSRDGSPGTSRPKPATIGRARRDEGAPADPPR